MWALLAEAVCAVLEALVVCVGVVAAAAADPVDTGRTLAGDCWDESASAEAA